MKKKRLFWLLLPSYWILTATAIISISVYVFSAMSQLYIHALENDIKTRAHLLSEFLPGRLDQGNEKEIDALCRTQGRSTGTRFTVVMPDGRVVGDTDAQPAMMGNHGNRKEIVEALAGEIGQDRRTSQTLDSELLYVAVPLFDDARNIRCAVRAALPITAIRNELRPMAARVIAAALATGLIAMLVCIAVVRHITHPLQTMSRAALKFAEGDFSHRISHQTADELDQLASSLNRMAAHLHETLSTVREQRNEQNAVLSSMVEGVLAIDRQGKIIHMNRVAGEILEVNHCQARSEEIGNVIRFMNLREFIQNLLRQQKSLACDIELRGDTGKIIQAGGTVLWNAENESIGALVVMSDVTHLRHLETVKTEFVANVSHELKTPITAIQGFVETLLSDEWKHSKAAMRFLKIIRQQAGRLNAIIDDLLFLSRLEQSEGTIPMKTVSLSKVVENAIHLCQLQAAGKKIKVNMTCPKRLEWPVNAPLIEQALVNLITNAIKYSKPEKKVDIIVQKHGREVAISVKDLGVGIDPNQVERLFERFYRVDSVRSGKPRGTGLGLSIVKHIVHAHNGRINVESTEGAGSTFTLFIPLDTESGVKTAAGTRGD